MKVVTEELAETRNVLLRAKRDCRNAELERSQIEEQLEVMSRLRDVEAARARRAPPSTPDAHCLKKTPLSGSGYSGYPPGMVPGMRKRKITPLW